MIQHNSIYGTKCASAPFMHQCETLGALYKSIADEFGVVQVNKPKPGEVYRKMYNPLTDIDRPAFRRMPADIQIVSPARLFRSTAWSYKGTTYLDANLFWEFEYRYEYAGQWRYDWMPVRLLSYCYINQTL